MAGYKFGWHLDCEDLLVEDKDSPMLFAEIQMLSVWVLLELPSDPAAALKGCCIKRA